MPVEEKKALEPFRLGHPKRVKCWLGSKPTNHDYQRSSEPSFRATRPHRSILGLSPLTVPPPLHIHVGGDITANHVAQREVLIVQTEDKNRQLAELRASGLATIKNGPFDALEDALRPNAELLLSQFRRLYKQAAPFELYGDGAL